MKVDLHTHTNQSDGSLSPAALLQLASDQRLQLFSITDHDTLAAYQDIDSAQFDAMSIVPGIELSTQWQRHNIHIVGLNIDITEPALLDGVNRQKAARETRAGKIAERLQKRLQLDPEMLSEVRVLAGNNQIGRPHFARYLCEHGVVDSFEDAFKKYLGPGKVGDIKEDWAGLDETVDWIRQSGGDAVLAHPLKYKLTRTKLLTLIDAFQQAGGKAIEVINGQQKPDETDFLAKVSVARNLFASCGSDFHTPDHRWNAIGSQASLPAACVPVWDNW